jgi:hypothetical protein
MALDELSKHYFLLEEGITDSLKVFYLDLIVLTGF